MNTIDNKLINGNVNIELIKLVLPMIFANLLNVAYNIVDTIWIGQIVGSSGLGAIAVSFPIILILISIASGLTTASNILVARYYGANDIKQVVYVSKISSNISFIISIVVSVIAYITAPALMKFLNTADSILEYSISYFRISMIGFPLIFFYFLISSLLRGIGDTVRPLVFLAISSIINVILDPIMIKGLFGFPRMGLDGAAYATLISQAIAIVVSFVYLKIKKTILVINPFYFIFDFKVINLLIKIGLPIATTQLIVSFSWLILNRLINQYGEIASAAIAICVRIDSLTYLPLLALSAGIATMTSQNIGAGKIERIKDIYKSGLQISIIISILMALIAVIFPEYIIKMFTLDQRVVDVAKVYMYIVMPSFIFLSIMFTACGIINGAGNTIAPMIFTFIANILVRIPAAYILSPKIGLIGIWISMSLGYFTVMILSFLYYHSNRWKRGINLS